jgi:hypothetical protein
MLIPIPILVPDLVPILANGITCRGLGLRKPARVLLLQPSQQRSFLLLGLCPIVVGQLRKF